MYRCSAPCCYSHAIANATKRSLINGTDFGDKLIAVMPDVIGQRVCCHLVGQPGRGDDGAQAGAERFDDLTSTYSYDGLGNLTSVAIADGRPRTVSFIDTLNGQVLQRDEADGNSSTGDPREVHYYYFDGMAVGDISNNGTSDVDYAASIAEHIKVPGTGPFRDGATSSTSYANFDQSYDPINGLTYQNAPTSYTVQAGDTLQSLAYALWGDASFWYLIADANGSASHSFRAWSACISD